MTRLSRSRTPPQSSEPAEGVEEVALFRSFKPSTCGFSFVVRADEAPALDVLVEYARYRAVSEEKSSGEALKVAGSEGAEAASASSARPRITWQREPYRIPLTIELAAPPGAPEIAPGLRLHRRIVQSDNRWLVTLQFINQYQELQGTSPSVPDELAVSDFISREEASFMQFAAKATCRTGLFEPRPQLLRGGDEDQQIAELIYRDVKEYAVGHTCSAQWEETEGGLPPSWVGTAWAPSSVVRRMDGAGDPVLAEAVRRSPVGSLHALRLSSATKTDLLATLEALADGYAQWLRLRDAEVPSLPAGLRAQARVNLARCDQAYRRMREGIDLLRSDSTAIAAFRLANRAMYIQAGWAAGERDAQTHKPDDASVDFSWYPFQIAFALVCLASASQRAHEDRRIFDLIWFPTGGGKTEAYLLLAAYVLFLRRLRDGDLGAGVGVFMRYTLRTLTVQQFQRASALITACELLRRESTEPLGNAPFSIGLWVGRDSTPNNFEEARNAVGELDPKSSPRQLTVCPACDQPLEWRVFEADAAVGCVCNTEGCPLSGPFGRLPVITVDDEIYRAPRLC